jgi:hypothetical protein
MTLPQIRGMYNGDRERKQVLVDYGFRLPSALDNRPLKFEEFEQRYRQVIFTSATPGPFELQHSAVVVEQVIRPPGSWTPRSRCARRAGQVDDLIGEIRERIARGERVLVTTLTKRMAEDLTEYLQEIGVKVQYLHSRSRPWSAWRSCATCGWANTTSSSASTCCARGWTCPRCRWWPSWTRTRKASCAHDVAHPDDRPRRAPRQRQGDHVCRRDHRLDARGD